MRVFALPPALLRPALRQVQAAQPSLSQGSNADPGVRRAHPDQQMQQMLQLRIREQPQYTLGQQGQTLQQRNGPSRMQPGPSGSDVTYLGGRPLGRQLLGPDTALRSPLQPDLLEDDWLGGGMGPLSERARASRQQQEGCEGEGDGRQLPQPSQWEIDDDRDGGGRQQRPQEGLMPWDEEPDSQGVAEVDPPAVISRSNGSGGRDPPHRQDVMDAGDGVHQGEGGEEEEEEDDDGGGMPSFELLGLPLSAAHTAKQQDIGLGGSRLDGPQGSALMHKAALPALQQQGHNQGATAASATAAGGAVSQGQCRAGPGLPPTVPPTQTTGQLQQKRTAALELPPQHPQKRCGTSQEERQPVAPVAIASGLEQHGGLLGSGGSGDRRGGKALEIFAGLSQADDTRHGGRRGGGDGSEGQHQPLGSATARPPAAAVGALTPMSLNQIGDGKGIVAVRAKPAGLVLPPGPATTAVQALYRPVEGPPRSRAKGGIGGGAVTSLRQLLREQEEDIDLDLGDL